MHADQCFRYLASSEAPVAIKAFSMTVCTTSHGNFQTRPGNCELLIEEQFHLGSAGFKARDCQILKQLDKDGY